MHEIVPQVVILLIIAGFVAGFVDSIAGGGGLITLPVLLLAGLSPVQALGTGKLQSLFGSGSATFSYAANGHVDLRLQWKSAALSALGSAFGAWLATRISSEWLRDFLPILMIAIALYFLTKPDISDRERAVRLPPVVFIVTVVPLIGFYDGIFGPGTGSFFMLAFVMLAGYGLLKATAHTKLLNFASNIGAFAVFSLSGAVDWRVGILMGLAQFAGARLGAHIAMKNGARLIRPLLVTVCLVLAARLLFS